MLERTLPDGTTKTYVNALNLTGDFAQMTWSHTGDVTAQVIPVERDQDPARRDRRTATAPAAP